MGTTLKVGPAGGVMGRTLTPTDEGVSDDAFCCPPTTQIPIRVMAS